MERPQQDLFPPNLKQEAIAILGTPWLAAILLKQSPVHATEPQFPKNHQHQTGLLHPHERMRLSHFRLAKRQTEFVTGRICAKLAVESYWKSVGVASQPPLSMVEIGSDPTGRPIVSAEGDRKPLLPEISITHGGEYAAAIAAELPCGIDLQQHKDNLWRVREKYCLPKELQLLEAFLPNMAPIPRLSLLWTAKEAAKKALSCRQMPGFLELELIQPLQILSGCFSLTLAVKVRKNTKMPDTVTALAAIFEDYGLSLCLLAKEQCYA